MDELNILKALENSPKGRLTYETGWDENPNAITTLITAVQEIEVDKPKREIVENAFKIMHMKERHSLSPKSPPKSSRSSKNRHSLPSRWTEGTSKMQHPANSANMKNRLLSSLFTLKAQREMNTAHSNRSSLSPEVSSRMHNQPEFRIEEVTSENWAAGETSSYSLDEYMIAADKKRLIPPPPARRKKSVSGSPRFKPSPYSSSTHTQTHSSTTSAASEATNTTPTRQPKTMGKVKKYGIQDETFNEEKIAGDLLLESSSSPFTYIEKSNAKYEEDLERIVKEKQLQRTKLFKEQEKEIERKATESESYTLNLRRQENEMLNRQWAEQEQAIVQDLQIKTQKREVRLKFIQDQKQQRERQAILDAEEKSRRAIEEAEKQEQLRLQQEAYEQELKRKVEAERREQELLQEQQRKDAEDKQRAEREAADAQKKLVELKKGNEISPELSSLILKEDFIKYDRSTQLLKQYDEKVSQIDGKDSNTKAFYIGAVKCINTPLNALADTNEATIMAKVEHFRSLLSGAPVSGGGSMQASFSSTSIVNGDAFVMKTLGFRFVKKSEADVNRGKTSVQPLASVGVHLCKHFPPFAALVQAYFYKLCPFLVPFSFPQGNMSIQEYAKELGHELSGAETAIQQTFLERLKGYCTLYGLMVLKFHNDGPFDIGDSTEFYTIGGAWQILAKTIKLDPQVDVTATVLHTLLDILDDRLFAVYKGQFRKLMTILIFSYLPRIKQITPAARSGSLSRLQIYLEKKYTL